MTWPPITNFYMTFGSHSLCIPTTYTGLFYTVERVSSALTLNFLWVVFCNVFVLQTHQHFTLHSVVQTVKTITFVAFLHFFFILYAMLIHHLNNCLFVQQMASDLHFVYILYLYWYEFINVCVNQQLTYFSHF